MSTDNPDRALSDSELAIEVFPEASTYMAPEVLRPYADIVRRCRAAAPIVPPAKRSLYERLRLPFGALWFFAVGYHAYPVIRHFTQ